jgi:hypothetical protein
MNYTRLALAAVAAFVADGLYGFVVYGNLLVDEFGKYPGVFRPIEAVNAKMPVMFAGIFVGMVIAAVIYAKGYAGGSGVAEGARFGALVGAFTASTFSVGAYATMNIGSQLAMSMGLAGLVEWTIVGIVIGLVYKPRVAPNRRDR